MKFEDLEVWKKSVELSVLVYKQTRSLADYGFKDQITRSALSIPSNIAEGFDRESNKETLYFLSIAKASCAELRTQVIIGQQVPFSDKEFSDYAKNETLKITTMLKALIRTRKSFN